MNEDEYKRKFKRKRRLLMGYRSRDSRLGPWDGVTGFWGKETHAFWMQ
jgi:hypothetical protein